MKRIEAFMSDDGQVFETRVDCARADYKHALSYFRGAVHAFDNAADGISVPRENLRTRLKALQSRLRTLQLCLDDLDHHDEDPTDPVRIEQAKKDHERAVRNLVWAIRAMFFSVKEEPAEEEIAI